MASEKQKAYAEARGRGLSRDQSAIMAGVDPSRESGNLNRLEHSAGVQEELARIRAETAANTNITKEDVANMFLEAYQMAKVEADPTGMVAAARELGKILGHYPEGKKKAKKEAIEDGVKKVLASMTDDELLKLSKAKVIDGEAKRLPEPGPDEKV